MKTKSPILFIGNDRDEALKLEQAIKQLQSQNPLMKVNNTSQAMDYLHSGKQRPYFIMMDIGQPNGEGFIFLESLIADPMLKTIPVVIFTASDKTEDIAKGFDLGVKGYIKKDFDHSKLTETIDVILKYWSLNQIPGLHKI